MPRSHGCERAAMPPTVTVATMTILTNPFAFHSAKKAICPIPIFGSLAQSKIPTSAAIQIFIYLPMFGLTRNRLTMYGYKGYPFSATSVNM
ncbi:hypothetical protein [Shewanella xiamenensis]|uniref:hypothetical protein n=1 Tax=Shewanella xiamenensis TaxID=332186 RepID=UPI00313AD1A0